MNYRKLQVEWYKIKKKICNWLLMQLKLVDKKFYYQNNLYKYIHLVIYLYKN